MGEGLNLLSPEAIAVYVTFLAGLAIGGLATWWRSRRGNWLVVRRKSQTPQITISDRVRENLQIQYKNTRVNQLVLNILEIENRGASIIDDISLRLIITPAEAFPKGGGEGFFVEVADLRDPLHDSEVNLIKGHYSASTLERHDLKEAAGRIERSDKEGIARIVDMLDWSILFRRPYMNPRRSYKTEVIELAIFSNQEIKIAIEGGGKGWYAKLVEFEGKPDWRGYFVVIGFLLLSTLASVLLNLPSVTGILGFVALSFIMVGLLNVLFFSRLY